MSEVAWIALLLGPLAVVAVSDLRTGRIPDAANAAIALLGAGHALGLGTALLLDRLLDCAILALLLLLLRHLYRSWRGRTGLGLGDVKFLGAATLWTGLGLMPVLILIACLSALGEVAIHALRGRRVAADMRLRFGPHLAAALLLVVLFDLVSA